MINYPCQYQEICKNYLFDLVSFLICQDLDWLIDYMFYLTWEDQEWSSVSGFWLFWTGLLIYTYCLFGHPVYFFYFYNLKLKRNFIHPSNILFLYFLIKDKGVICGFGFSAFCNTSRFNKFLLIRLWLHQTSR